MIHQQLPGVHCVPTRAFAGLAHELEAQRSSLSLACAHAPACAVDGSKWKSWRFQRVSVRHAESTRGARCGSSRTSPKSSKIETVQQHLLLMHLQNTFWGHDFASIRDVSARCQDLERPAGQWSTQSSEFGWHSVSIGATSQAGKIFVISSRQVPTCVFYFDVFEAPVHIFFSFVVVGNDPGTCRYDPPSEYFANGRCITMHRRWFVGDMERRCRRSIGVSRNFAVRWSSHLGKIFETGI